VYETAPVETDTRSKKDVYMRFF